MSRKRWHVGRALFACIAGILVLAAPAPALQEILPAVEEATILDPSGEARLLLRFASLAPLEEEWIATATLHLPLVGAFPEAVGIAVDVSETPWTASATWDSPWSEDPGDPQGEQPVTRIVPAGVSAGFLSFDVTYLVRSMQWEEIPDHGFLVYPHDLGREGFTPLELASFGARALAMLEITYRKTSVHYDQSARELVGEP